MKEFNCQECRKCCQEYRMYIKYKGIAERLRNLNTNKIKVKELQANKVWLVTFAYTCEHLLSDDFGKYHCTENELSRPSICVNNPHYLFSDKDSDRMVKEEMKKCVGLREYLR